MYDQEAYGWHLSGNNILTDTPTVNDKFNSNKVINDTVKDSFFGHALRFRKNDPQTPHTTPITFWWDKTYGPDKAKQRKKSHGTEEYGSVAANVYQYSDDNKTESMSTWDEWELRDDDPRILYNQIVNGEPELDPNSDGPEKYWANMDEPWFYNFKPWLAHKNQLPHLDREINLGDPNSLKTLHDTGKLRTTGEFRAINDDYLLDNFYGNELGKSHISTIVKAKNSKFKKSSLHLDVGSDRSSFSSLPLFKNAPKTFVETTGPMMSDQTCEIGLNKGAIYDHIGTRTSVIESTYVTEADILPNPKPSIPGDHTTHTVNMNDETWIEYSEPQDLSWKRVANLYDRKTTRDNWLDLEQPSENKEIQLKGCKFDEECYGLCVQNPFKEIPPIKYLDCHEKNTWHSDKWFFYPDINRTLGTPGVSHSEPTQWSDTPEKICQFEAESTIGYIDPLEFGSMADGARKTNSKTAKIQWSNWSGNLCAVNPATEIHGSIKTMATDFETEYNPQANTDWSGNALPPDWSSGVNTHSLYPNAPCPRIGPNEKIHRELRKKSMKYAIT